MTQLVALLAFSLVALHSPPTYAADGGAKKKVKAELTKEERSERADKMEKMAAMHTKMAECLRSDKPMSECHEMMKKECPMAKEGHCPMMEGGKGMHGHHHGKGKMEKDEDGEKED